MRYAAVGVVEFGGGCGCGGGGGGRLKVFGTVARAGLFFVLFFCDGQGTFPLSSL